MFRLPAEVTSFVGRRRELAEARRLLAEARLLTLTGAGGAGKTRLAVQVAERVRRAFPDGVCFVELALLPDAELLARTVAKAVGLRDSSAEPTARLAEYLADKRLLLVLDNCEHLVDGCAVLVGKLLASAPGLRVLATSRHVLGIEAERLLQVSPLPVPERINGGTGHLPAAVSLFRDRAVSVAPDFVLDTRNQDQVLAVCRRLDGIPLAIELAAVWIRTLSPAEILDRLEDRFSLLTRGSRTAPARQQTMAGTLEWSYQLCSPAEQLLWSRLAVFAGGFDLEAAEDVCSGDGVDPGEMLGLVAGLIDKSIVIRQPDARGQRARYQMLQTIRRYGLNMLTVAGQEKLTRFRHAEYYRKLACRYRMESFGPDQWEWIRRMLAEHPNIRLALEFGLSGGGDVRASTDIVAGLWRFWYAGGLLGEGHRWLERALTRDTGPTARRGRALWTGAFNAVRLGEVDVAREMLAECAELAEELHDPALRAGYAESFGYTLLVAGERRAARGWFDDAVAGHQRTGDLDGVVTSLILTSMATVFLDDPRGAQSAERALRLCREHGASWSGAHAVWAVALHQWRAGDHAGAASLIQETIRQLNVVPDWNVVLAYQLELLAWCASGVGRHEHASRLLGAATTAWRLSGSRGLATPASRATHEHAVGRARAELGGDRFQTEFGKGLALSIDEAINEALGERVSTTARRRARRGEDLPLTRREKQVAELLAKGLTNKDIAVQLVIAQRTAETHVENVLRKLGFTSRAQIATWFAEHPEISGGGETTGPTCPPPETTRITTRTTPEPTRALASSGVPTFEPESD